MRIRLPGPYKKKPAIPQLFELPIPYDVLVAATEDCLPGYMGVGGVEFEKIHETSGRTKYKLFHYQLGDLGKLTICKLADDLSKVHFDGPPTAASQRRKPTQEERTEMDSAPNKDEWIKSNIAINKKIKKESVDLYNRRKDHLGDVISGYRDRLSRENIWPKNPLNEVVGGEDELADIDQACMAWADRPKIPHRNMEEFLSEWDINGGGFYSKDEFKRALRDAFSRGIIDKDENGRFKLKSRS